MAITQVITTLPAAPDPATMTRDEFNTAAAAYVLAQKAMVPELNTWAGEVNAIAATAVGDVATAIGAAAADTPVDADKFTFRKAADGVLKSITLANLKAVLKAYFDPLYAALSGATFTGPVLFDTVADIASAATIDLTAYGSGTIATVTGTTATSAFTMNDGQHMTLVAAGAWPLTYNATTNKIAGGADYICTAGEELAVFKTGGVVHMVPAFIRRSPKIITFTRDMTAATGTVAYTGVGFRPTNVELFAVIDGTVVNSHGFDNGTEAMSVQTLYAGTDTVSTTKSIALYTAAGASQQASISAKSNDGFSLDWVKFNSPTGTATIIARVS